MHFSKTYPKFIHEHAVQLRSEFANIASINASKNVSKMPKSVFKVLKESYDALSEKFLNQLGSDKILADTQAGFERIITAVRNQAYEQARALEDLAGAGLQTEGQSVGLQNKEHDAFETRLLMKIQEPHNIDTFRAMKKALICQKINNRVHQDSIILKPQTSFDPTHEKADQ